MQMLKLLWLLKFIVIFQAAVKFKTFVINLPDRQDRLEHMHEFTPVDFEAVRAVSSNDLERWFKQGNSKETAPEYLDSELAYLTWNGTKLPPGVSFGQLGCWLSHVQLLLKISRMNSVEPILILEDDVRFSGHFAGRTEEAFNHISPNWDLYIVGHCKSRHFEDILVTRMTFKARPGQAIFCTHGYFVNGSKGARNLLKSLNVPEPMVIDYHWWKDGSLVRYFESPPSITQVAHFKSDATFDTPALTTGFSMIVYVLFFGVCSLFGVILTMDSHQKKTYTAFLINLDRRSDRLNMISSHMASNFPSISIERIAAVDGRDLLKNLNSGKFSTLDDKEINFINAYRENGNKISVGVGEGEVGCWLSHVKALLRIARLNTSEPTLILEDDARPHDFFLENFESSLTQMPADWGTYHSGHCSGREKCAKPTLRGTFCRLDGINPLVCLQAYWVHGSQAARELLKVVNAPNAAGMVVDLNLYRANVSQFMALPNSAPQVRYLRSDLR